MVELLYHNQEKLGRLRDIFSKTPDLERLCSRLAMDRAHGKDMAAVKNALFSLRQLEELLAPLEAAPNVPHTPLAAAPHVPLAGTIAYESPEALTLNKDGLISLYELGELLQRGLAEDPSILLSEGNLIRQGYDNDLDRLRELRDSGRKLLEDYLDEERELT